MTSQILRAGPADAERLAAMLGRAFEDDPVQAWLFPRAEGRRARVQVFFDLEVRDILLPRGEVWASPGRESAAGWMPPVSRHGFEVTEEVQLPGGPPVWLMWRDPQPGHG